MTNAKQILQESTLSIARSSTAISLVIEEDKKGYIDSFKISDIFMHNKQEEHLISKF